MKRGIILILIVISLAIFSGCKTSSENNQFEDNPILINDSPEKRDKIAAKELEANFDDCCEICLEEQAKSCMNITDTKCAGFFNKYSEMSSLCSGQY